MPKISDISLNDGVRIPQLGFGTSPMPDEQVRPAVVAALEVGYRHIDTAAAYANEVGVGQGLRDSGLPRGEVFVTTKLSNTDHAKRDVRPALEASLERLGLDYVDLYLIHWPLPAKGRFVEVWEDFIDLRSAGLTRSIGVSNFVPEHLDLILDETGIVPSVNQFELHPTFQDEELINFCDDAKIAVEAYAPLGNTADLSDPAVVQIATEAAITPAQAILAWHLSRGFIAIPKSSKPERIGENFAAAGVQLTSEQLEAMDGLNRGNKVWADPLRFNG